MTLPTTGYFLGWDSFQTQLLFGSFMITERWQFVLTWFAVLLSVVAFHFLQHVILSLDESMAFIIKRENRESKDIIDYSNSINLSDRSMRKIRRPVGWQTVKFVHAVLSAVKYGLSLILMLVAMTFNPSLFLALVIGSAMGEYICCDVDIDLTIGDGRAHCRLVADGELVLELSISRRVLPLPARPMEMSAYAHLDDVTRRTPFTGRPTGVRGGPLGARLTVGTAHPMARDLRALGLPRRAVMSSVIGNLAATFGAPVPL